MFYMASLPKTDVEEDHGDIGQMTSNSGQEYSPVVDFVQRTRDRSAWRFFNSWRPSR